MKVVVTSQITGYTDKASDTVTVAAVGPRRSARTRASRPPRSTASTAQHQADLHVMVSYLQTRPAADDPRPDEPDDGHVAPRLPLGDQGLHGPGDLRPARGDGHADRPRRRGADPQRAANYDPSEVDDGGYDSRDDANGTVYQRLADIWQAETNDYKLTYISTTVSFAGGHAADPAARGGPDQSSGNCIEMTLLYASVAEALGMDAAMILIPGHAYVAIRVDDTDQNYYFIETTMIGQATFDEAGQVRPGRMERRPGHVAGRRAGLRLGGRRDGRKDGITPIPWH